MSEKDEQIRLLMDKVKQYDEIQREGRIIREKHMKRLTELEERFEMLTAKFDE